MHALSLRDTPGMACLTSRFSFTRMSTRGEVVVTPDTRGQTSRLSTGGRPEAAAQVSAGETPARPQNVAYLQHAEGRPACLLSVVCGV